jgi:hypothetical protein
LTLVTVTGMLRQIRGAGKRYDDEGAKPVAAARAGEIGACTDTLNQEVECHDRDRK